MRAVLFDLDDTVFDHKHSRLKGLAALQDIFPELRAVPLECLEEEHELLLQSDYGLVLDGHISMDESRILRTRRLCNGHGLILDNERAREASSIYRKAYEKVVQPVPGVVELLEQLSQRVRLGVITNGLEKQQREKLRSCEVEKFFDAVVVSESVGLRKPDHAIFHAALKALDAVPAKTALIGDSWSADIIPAHELGIRTYWLNRYGRTCPNALLSGEIRSYSEIDLRTLVE